MRVPHPSEREHALPLVWLRVGPVETYCGKSIKIKPEETQGMFAERVLSIGTRDTHLARCPGCRRAVIAANESIVEMHEDIEQQEAFETEHAASIMRELAALNSVPRTRGPRKPRVTDADIHALIAYATKE